MKKLLQKVFSKNTKQQILDSKEVKNLKNKVRGEG